MINQGPAGPVPGLARAVRILHGAILLGLVIMAAVFVAVLRLRTGPVLGQVKSLGPVMAALGAVLMVLALTVLKPRLPSRPAEQSPDQYWSDPNVRGVALLLWVALEAGGMVSAVGYLLTAGTAPAVVAGAAILALLLVRPSRLEDVTG